MASMEHEFSGFTVVLAGDESSGRIDVYQRFTAHEGTRKFVEHAIRAALAKEARDAAPQEGLEVFLQPLFQYRVAERWWNEEAPDRPYAYLSEETQQLYLGRVRKVLGLSVLAARDAAKELGDGR